MAVKRFKSAATTLRRSPLLSTSGFTLVEVMLATLILLVAVIGASGFRYYAALDGRRAAMQTTAVRVGQLLCESWRGLSDPNTFDPVAHFGSELAITTVAETRMLEYHYAETRMLEYYYKAADFTLLGVYTIAANGVSYYAVLSWKDVGSGLRALNVVVVWPLQGQIDGDYLDYDACKSFKLTTYTST